MDHIHIAAVISAWTANPVFRKAAIEKMGDGSASTFVIYQTIIGALVCAGVALHQPFMYKYAVNGGYLGAFFVSCCTLLALSSSYFLSMLVAKNNPGEVMATLNGLANLSTYLLGTLVYGEFTWRGVLGAALVSAGIYFIRST